MFNCGFSILQLSDVRIFASETIEKLSELIRFVSKYKIADIFQTNDQIKGLKGSIVNGAYPLIHGGSFEITTTAPHSRKILRISILSDQKSEKNRLKSFFILLILLSFTSLSNYIKLETTDENDMILSWKTLGVFYTNFNRKIIF